MLFVSFALTLALTAAETPRFHLLESQLTVAQEVGSGEGNTKCTRLYPKTVPHVPELLTSPTPDAALKKSIADAFGKRASASACAYGVQGVRRHDPRFGMRQVTLELTPPTRAPLRLLLRTVVGRFEPMHDLRHNQAEVYAGVIY